MRTAKTAAFAGVLTAMSVVLLFVGVIVSPLSYVLPIATGLLMILLIESVSVKSALLTYFSTSFLSFILFGGKETVLFYVFFFGYYPILRLSLSKIKIKFLRLILKLIFNVAMAGVQLVLIYVLGIPFDNMFGKMGIALFFVALNLIFILYDFTFDMLVTIYDKKLKRKITGIIK